MTWFRALLAAGLSVIMPGAGHVLVRDWFRAAVFAGLFFSVSVFFLPFDQIAAAGPKISYDEALRLMSEQIDPKAQFFLSFISLFATIDATVRALGFPPDESEDADGLTCPECGKEIDRDLEFCHWCTTRLEPETSDDEPPSVSQR